MTETSYFWAHGGGGDASNSPYTSDELSDAYRMLGEHSRQHPSLLSWTTIHNLAITTSTGNVTVGKGLAKIDGKIYMNHGPVSFKCWTPGYYRLVLRKTFAEFNEKGVVGGQEVRLAMRYHSSDVASTLVEENDGVVWEHQLGLFYSDGKEVYPYASPSATDIPDVDGLEGLWEFSRNTVNLLARQGGSATHWATAGSNMYVCGQSYMECGMIAVAANPQAVSFRVSFPYNPVVIIQPYEAGAWAGNNWCISAIGTAGFSARFDSITNLQGFAYLAIGPEY